MMLYARAKSGAVLSWEVEVSGNKHRTISGQLDGQKVTSEWTVCEGKNLGRSNETTPEQQAALEAKAKEQKKIDREGYVRSLAELDIKVVFKEPMLANKFEEVTAKKPVVFPVYSQPKLDGMRCIVNSFGMFSRTGNPVVSAPHIAETLKHLTDLGLEFDGELYNHEYRDNFNKIISLVKKGKPTESDLKESAEKIEYWIYDIRDNTKTFSQRIQALARMFIPVHGGSRHPGIRLVYTELVNSQKALDVLFESYLQDSFEGQMVRTDTVYEFCRTNALLKRKLMQDQEFEIVDVLEGKGNRSGIAGKVVIKLPNGELCESSIIGSHDYCRKLLEQKTSAIGKMATVKFQGFTPAGALRFPEMKVIRDYE